MSGVIKVLTKMLQYFDHTQLIGCHLKITDAINMFYIWVILLISACLQRSELGIYLFIY